MLRDRVYTNPSTYGCIIFYFILFIRVCKHYFISLFSSVYLWITNYYIYLPTAKLWPHTIQYTLALILLNSREFVVRSFEINTGKVETSAVAQTNLPFF